NKLASLQHYHHIVDNHIHAPSPLAVVALVPTDIDVPVFEPEPAFDASKPMRLVTACSSTFVPITVPHV
ncbi:hypothetical protein KI387_017502, partial [Taxus chinensis]